MSAKLASYTGAAVVIMVLLLIKATLVLIITLFQCHFPSSRRMQATCWNAGVSPPCRIVFVIFETPFSSFTSVLELWFAPKWHQRTALLGQTASWWWI